MVKYNIDDLKGVIPALVTPFNKDESINEKGMRSLVDHLIKKGVNGLYLTGSTGEGFLMTPEERKEIIEIVVNQNKGRVPLLAHVGAIGTKISIDLAKHAELVGCDAISSVPPFYWKFDQKNIFTYYRDITESTKLPMVVYNIPLAGLMGFEQIKEFSTIDNVKGIKFTATDHFEIMRMKEEIGADFKIYSGCDEMSFSGMGFGADGLIGSFSNLMPELFIKIYKAVKANDYPTAKETQKVANALIIHCTQGNYVGIIKRALTWMGIDGGYCRRPFINLTEEDEKYHKTALRAIKDKHNITEVDFLENI